MKFILSKEDILSALKEVIDPEIGINIVDLNMVKALEIKDNKVSVTIALTVPSCPLSHTLTQDIQEVLTQRGVKEVNVKTTYMSREELEDLRRKIQSNRERQIRTQSIGGIDRLDKGKIRYLLAIVSGKGGVGKSFVTSILGVELRREGYEIGILDADITGPSIPKIFGLNSRPKAGERGVLPVESETGIKVMSMNLIMDDPNAPTIWRGPLINSVIRQMYTQVDWGDLHFMLVDLPPGTSDAPLTVFQSLPLDCVIVVTSPQDLALMVVSKAVNMARRLNVPLLGVVENMSYVKCPKCSERINLFGKPKGILIAEKLKVPFLGSIPIDPKIAELCDKGEIENYKSEEITEIAKRIRVTMIKNVESDLPPLAWSKK
ncbi:MAG: Mrp/NBP35 family ATP-binding protein [Nitrososphaerales archaeon]